MPVIHHPAHPTDGLGGTRFTALAPPSRGSSDTAVWQVEIAPGTPATPHSLTREEAFVVLEGAASVQLDGVASHAQVRCASGGRGGLMLELSSAGGAPVRHLSCLPSGGQERLADGSTSTPPWAE